MKVEIRCSACSGGFLVDESSLGGELPCPGCFAPIDTTPVAVSAPAPEPVVEAHAPVAVATRTEVVCPRCSLHFNPDGQAPAAEASGRQTVLIVEDMAYFREIASDALQDEYEVLTAETRQQALDVLSRRPVDLIVLDLTLDGGDHGVDLLRAFSDKPCRILIYTAKDESEMYGDSWEELQQLGADDIVIKGMNVGESLARKVNRLLGRESEDDES